jgi:general secretion pathway protein N
MLERLRLTTAMAGLLLLWATVLLVLGWFGAGSRYPALPDDPARATPLAAVPADAPTPRLGAFALYTEIGARPLLTADRRPAPVIAGQGGEAGSATLDADLTSVLITARVQLAILRERQGGRSLRVKVGDNVEGTAWRLVSLAPRQAVFEGPGGQQTLELRVFDGRGGEAPTALASAPGATAPAAVASATPAATPSPANLQQSMGAAPANASASPSAPAQPATSGPPVVTQESQIEAIRRRIEARRAQIAAERAAQGGQ